MILKYIYSFLYPEIEKTFSLTPHSFSELPSNKIIDIIRII